MIFNSQFKKKDFGLGAVIFKNVVFIEENDIQNFVVAYEYLKNIDPKAEMKNALWSAFSNFNNQNDLLLLQKSILKVLAAYTDLYPESIHSIQWQERLNVDIEESGDPSFIFNPSQSLVKLDKTINTIPFSRQIVVEVCIDDNYSGKNFEWIYLKDFCAERLEKGDILMYPASYLFSKKHNSIINGRKIYITTFLNGGKDFLAEDRDFDSPEENFMFSYMR